MRKTTNQAKEKAGTMRKDRIRHIKGGDNIPDPQDYLTKEGIVLYHAICIHLKAAKSLQSIDSLFVSAAAHSAYLIAKHSKLVSKNGAVQTFVNGTTNITGDYAVLKTERGDFFRFCRELGLTPRSREQLLAFSGKVFESDDPVEVLIKKMSAK